MGFWDRAIKKGLGNEIANGISNGINNAMEGSIGNKLSEAFSPLTDAIDKMTDNTSVSSYESEQNMTICNSGESLANGDIAENFYSILSAEFSGYEIKRNVSPTTIGGSPVAKEYTFGLYEGGVPKLFILLTPHNKYRNRPYIEAKNACESNGIQFMYFFTHFNNERNYVIDRIKRAL